MTDTGRSAFGRAARVLLALGVLSLGATGLWAQGTTGKIQGTVLDPTGQPIGNAQVFVLGTSFAALTNEDGFYFLNNVPAGVYSMRAQFIGYQPAQMEGVRILADQTLTADFRLSGAVALEAITITAAEAPIVPRDQVTSKAIVTGEQIDDLPVNSTTAVVLLQPGVIAGRGGSLRIRGGRSNEAVWFIDGAPVRRMDNASVGFGFATNTLQEVSVTTGAMDAAFGDAQSGVISLVTRSGGSRFVGTLAYETDEPMGNSLSTGYNRFEAAVSGPVFGNLTFSIGGTLTGNRSAATAKGIEDIPTYTFAGLDTTVVSLSGSDSLFTAIPQIIQFGGQCEAADNAGFECQGRRRPYGWATDTRANAKLQYTYGSGSRVSFSALTNINQNMGAQSTLNVESESGARLVSNLFVLNWVQQVFRGAASELAFDLNLSHQRYKRVSGVIDRATGLGNRDPFLGMVLSPLDFVTDWDRFAPVDPANHLSIDPLTGGFFISRLETQEDWDALIENVRYDRGTLRSYLDRFEIGARDIPRVNAYGTLAGPSTFGMTTGQSYQFENRWVGRANIDWQADRYNRFKFGVEGTRADLGRYEMTTTRKSFGNGYTGEPYKVAAYAQDRLDLGDVVIELGVRWDRFDTRTIFPLVPGRLFTNPAFDDALTVDAMTCPTPRFGADGVQGNADDCDITQYVWAPAESHSGISPRVRVSFPVTDRTGFRLSYAHQTQVPDLFNMYNGTNNDLANTNTNDQFGGDADLGKTIIFEFGIRHAFSEDMVLDIAAYNKDKVSDITYRVLPFFDTFTDRVSNVNILTNADFGNVRGVDVQLLRRFGNVFSGQVSYTFQNAKSTGSDPTDFLNGLSRAPFGVLGERPEAPQTTLRTRDDRSHNIQGSFSLAFPSDYLSGSAVGAVLRDLGVFGTFQLRSGLPYTRLENNGRGNRSTGGFGLIAELIEPLQSSETPWEKFFDLRVTKGFRLGPTDWTLYADVRNVLNFTNKTAVFSETGDVVNEEYLQRGFLDPQLLSMEQDALASGALTTITKDIGTPEERNVSAIDLRNLGVTCPTWVGSGGPVGCVMLQRTEQRFGDGDGYYDVEEQVDALTAWYDSGNSPSSFFSSGRQVRLGLQLTF